MQRLYRSKTDKKLAGICGGVAEIYNWDPSLVRLVFVFVGFVTGGFPLLVTYVIGWAIIPVKSAPVS